MTKKKHSGSSKRWLQEHFDDKYVHEAKKQGLRSRAVFKLKEILEKDRLIKSGMSVVDLGAAPGGWSQLCSEFVGIDGVVIACDILPMDPLAGVEFLQGDFRELDVLNALLTKIGNRDVNIVISDMAPNMSGNQSVDQAGSIYLCELALDMCHKVLVSNGSFIIKAFQGEGFDEFVKMMKSSFGTVKVRKPSASRARSREVYLIGSGFKH